MQLPYIPSYTIFRKRTSNLHFHLPAVAWHKLQLSDPRAFSLTS